MVDASTSRVLCLKAACPHGGAASTCQATAPQIVVKRFRSVVSRNSRLEAAHKVAAMSAIEPDPYADPGEERECGRLEL